MRQRIRRRYPAAENRRIIRKAFPQSRRRARKPERFGSAPERISDRYRSDPMLRESNGILRQTNLSNESEEYLRKREELRHAEVELRNQRERVAQLRRQLPIGPAVEDYVFEEGP